MRVAASIASLLCLFLVLAGTSGAQQDRASAASPRLTAVVVTRSDRGGVYCGLWRGPEGYPTERRLAVGRARDLRIVDRRGHCVFEGAVEPGAEYAVAAFHDENANGELDHGVFGIPTEGTGASNGARGSMGPPPWQHARFVFPEVREHRITITIGY